MSFVTKRLLSVDINLSLIYLLSNTYHVYVFLPGDGDNGDKRLQRLNQPGLQRGDKRERLVTKVSETLVSVLMMGFCHHVHFHVDSLRGPCLKALRLLSPLSPSPGEYERLTSRWCASVGSKYSRSLYLLTDSGGRQKSKALHPRTVRLDTFSCAGVYRRGGTLLLFIGRPSRIVDTCFNYRKTICDIFSLSVLLRIPTGRSSDGPKDGSFHEAGALSSTVFN